MGGFDESDVKLRVQASFSLPELRRLVLGWGATPEEAEGDGGALAQRAVRLGLRRFGPDELLRRLRAEKPLTEWPDPAAEEDERWAPRPPAPSLEEGEATSVDLVPPIAADPPADLQAATPAQPEPTPPDLARPEAAPPSWREPAPAPRSTRLGGEAPSNPLVFLEPEALRRRDAPRRRWGLLAIGAGALLLLGCAVAAGTWLTRGRQEGAATPTPGPQGPAVRAAGVLDEGLRRVAEGCAIDVAGQPSIEVFALAQEACGREEAQIWSRKKQRERERAVAGNDEPDPAAQPFRYSTPPVPIQDRLPLKLQQAPAAPAGKPGPGKAEPVAPKLPPASGSCTSRCQRTRGECDKSCGKEPSDASQYGPFQACASRCVSAETRCRRECG